MGLIYLLCDQPHINCIYIVNIGRPMHYFKSCGGNSVTGDSVCSCNGTRSFFNSYNMISSWVSGETMQVCKKSAVKLNLSCR